MDNTYITVHSREEYEAVTMEYIKKGYSPFASAFQQTVFIKDEEVIVLTLIDEV